MIIGRPYHSTIYVGTRDGLNSGEGMFIDTCHNGWRGNEGMFGTLWDIHQFYLMLVYSR